jgi:hypothetical protein
MEESRIFPSETYEYHPHFISADGELLEWSAYIYLPDIKDLAIAHEALAEILFHGCPKNVIRLQGKYRPVSGTQLRTHTLTASLHHLTSDSLSALK